jgi:hypothetical protein
MTAPRDRVESARIRARGKGISVRLYPDTLTCEITDEVRSKACSL